MSGTEVGGMPSRVGVVLADESQETPPVIQPVRSFEDLKAPSKDKADNTSSQNSAKTEKKPFTADKVNEIVSLITEIRNLKFGLRTTAGKPSSEEKLFLNYLDSMFNTGKLDRIADLDVLNKRLDLAKKLNEICLAIKGANESAGKREKFTAIDKSLIFLLTTPETIDEVYYNLDKHIRTKSSLKPAALPQSRAEETVTVTSSTTPPPVLPTPSPNSGPAPTELINGDNTLEIQIEAQTMKVVLTGKGDSAALMKASEVTGCPVKEDELKTSKIEFDIDLANLNDLSRTTLLDSIKDKFNATTVLTKPYLPGLHPELTAFLLERGDVKVTKVENYVGNDVIAIFQRLADGAEISNVAIDSSTLSMVGKDLKLKNVVISGPSMLFMNGTGLDLDYVHVSKESVINGHNIEGTLRATSHLHAFAKDVDALHLTFALSGRGTEVDKLADLRARTEGLTARRGALLEDCAIFKLTPKVLTADELSELSSGINKTIGSMRFGQTLENLPNFKGYKLKEESAPGGSRFHTLTIGIEPNESVYNIFYRNHPAATVRIEASTPGAPLPKAIGLQSQYERYDLALYAIIHRISTTLGDVPTHRLDFIDEDDQIIQVVGIEEEGRTTKRKEDRDEVTPVAPESDASSAVADTKNEEAEVTEPAVVRSEGAAAPVRLATLRAKLARVREAASERIAEREERDQPNRHVGTLFGASRDPLWRRVSDRVITSVLPGPVARQVEPPVGPKVAVARNAPAARSGTSIEPSTPRATPTSSVEASRPSSETTTEPSAETPKQADSTVGDSSATTTPSTSSPPLSLSEEVITVGAFDTDNSETPLSK